MENQNQLSGTKHISNTLKRINMPCLNTTNSLYKFITAKLCHPMWICVETSAWTANKWYGIHGNNHVYHIRLYPLYARIRYEDDYYNEEIINKYGKNS